MTEVERSTEPTVHIAPPPWFARLAVAAAVLVALLALAATAADLATGNALAALISVVGGALVAALAYDVSTRRVISHGDELEVRQWFTTVTLRRADLAEFTAARASFFRWDIVAVPEEGRETRLWVTRMLVAGRRQRQGWLQDLEAWRTWIGPPRS